jgi:phenylacetate-CoA oxygenase PaaH subunit
VIWEIFRQERKGQPFESAGSVEAPDAEFAEAWAREQYGRRGESVALWLVPRDAIHTVDKWADEFELKHVVTGHGPLTEERLALRRRFLEQESWVRDIVAAA